MNEYRIRGISFSQPTPEYFRLGLKTMFVRSKYYPFGGVNDKRPLLLLLCSMAQDFVVKLVPYKKMMEKFEIEDPREWCELPRRCVFAIGLVKEIIPITPEFIDSLSDQELATDQWQPDKVAVTFEWLKILDRPIDLELQTATLFRISDHTFERVQKQL
jgi:hypothetical protein